MKKYLINGKEVYPMCLVQPMDETFEIRTKFNKLLEALDQTPSHIKTQLKTLNILPARLVKIHMKKLGQIKRLY